MIYRANGFNKEKMNFTLDCADIIAPYSDWRILTEDEIMAFYWKDK